MKAPIAFAIGCIFTTLHSVSAVHCNKQHTIVDGDTCKTLSKTYNISEKVIGSLNPSVDSVCDHLENGLKLCVGSSVKSLNKSSPKTTSKKTIHTKKKMTTIIKPNKKTSKKPSKKVSKKVSKKSSKKASKTVHGAIPTPAARHKSSKSSDGAMPTPAVRHKSSKSSDGAMPTPAVRHKDSKKDTSKAQKMESTDDSSDDSAPQPTEDASSDDSDAQPTADSTDASTDDSDAQPAADSTDASNDDPTPTEDSSNASDDGSAQPTDDGSAQAPGAGPQPSNTTQPALNYFDSLTIQLTSADDFCLLLPSSPGGKKDNNNKIDVEAISKSEGSAVAFCLKKSAEKSPKAHNMPEGLINSAYFFKNETADYSQISGTINPKAYMLSPKDYGGQYDNHGKGAPANSMCYGYKYLVELIEPNTNDFCIRCCNVYEDCNAGRSAYGCQRVVSNGRYT